MIRLMDGPIQHGLASVSGSADQGLSFSDVDSGSELGSSNNNKRARSSDQYNNDISVDGSGSRQPMSQHPLAVSAASVEKWSIPKKKNPHIVVDLSQLLGFQSTSSIDHINKRNEYLSIGRVVCIVCAKPLNAGKQIVYRHQTVNTDHLEARRKNEYANLSAILSALPSPIHNQSSANSSIPINNNSCTNLTGSIDRRSPYDMINMTDALKTILTTTIPLQTESVPLASTLHRTSAEQITAQTPFPSYPISIMDGYAVNAPLAPGTYTVESIVLAGSGEFSLSEGKVAYICTGAKLPLGANAVVKKEDTRGCHPSLDITEDDEVEIVVGVEWGANVRQIGSDMRPGDVLLRKGIVITAIEMGLLATYGIQHVSCSIRPVVGVMSTGDELVDIEGDPAEGEIRDSNRICLLNSFDALQVMRIDYGIVRDSRETLRARLLNASSECDIMISSGGVSMGAADLIKPILTEIGTIHFGRLNMKPGKPTTFATILRPDGKLCLYFGLPGNPASCIVCKQLLVDPCIQRLLGHVIDDCLLPRIKVSTASSFIMDNERPEFHRVTAIIEADKVSVYSTGNQRSSRLMSMATANALVMVPNGSGTIPIGSQLYAYLTGPLKNTLTKETADAESTNSTGLLNGYFDTQFIAKKKKVSSSMVYFRGEAYTIRVALLTVSDRASAGVYTDESGPEMRRQLEEMCLDETWPSNVGVRIVETAIVPDGLEDIQRQVSGWTDGGEIDVVLTSGGTGFGVRDLTPEAVRPLLHREAPGVAQALLSEGLRHTNLAVLSRPIAGTRNKCFVATLPGSVKAVKENMVALKPLLPRIVELLVYFPSR